MTRSLHKKQLLLPLSPAESYQADRLAIEGGVAGIVLMENAGRAVFDVITKNYAPCSTLVLCGTGNNGGDGFIIARLLLESKWPVTTTLIGNPENIKNDAAIAFKRFVDAGGEVADFTTNISLCVDALFGIGLTRPIGEPFYSAMAAIKAKQIPTVAVDIASGINADSGKIMGIALPAQHTVTFFRPKHGHFMAEGREYSGKLTVADIGIPESVLDIIKGTSKNSL